ncbi:hypothetical protein ACIBKY_51075 [Nonomuraea sp. NPDC050394]
MEPKRKKLRDTLDKITLTAMQVAGLITLAIFLIWSILQLINTLF